MPAVNHLKDVEAQNLFHAVAYGKHLVSGTLAKSRVTGTSPTHVIILQQMLGRGEWDGCEGLWWSGVEIKPDSYRFYPGKQAALPVHKTYTADSSTDYLTSTAHGYENGDQILLAPGSLPGGLFTDFVYYVKNKTANTFQLSTLNGGSAVDLTSNGSGTLKLWKNDTSQGIDLAFASDTPHSNVAWIVAYMPTGLGEVDTKANPPYGLKGIFRTSKVNDYDTDGDVTGYAYSANPARIVADLILAKGNLPASRIDWAAWCAWRDYCDELIAYDYKVLPKFDGFGLTTKLYNGTAFDTLVTKRIDPVIEFGPSAGSPGVGVNTDNFSVVYEGWLKAKYTETYTFYLTHTHGARLYIDEAGDPPIDQWAASGTHSTTFDMVAGQFYYFKIEWKHTTGNAEIRIEWESPSQKREVIDHRHLYPNVENRVRYEAHPFWAGPTRLDDAVRVVLNLCNSTVQDVGGKLKFLCLEQLTTQSYHFTDARTVDGSVVLKARDPMALRNTWQANVRDIDSQYLERPIDPILIERPSLIDAAGRKIDGEAIELFNCSLHQAYRTLDNIVKRMVDSKFQIELTGMADSFSVLAGDRVKVDVEFLNWTEKDMLVVESNDLSSEETADERTFVLQEWPDFTEYEAV